MAFVQRLRGSDLFKVPGVAESIDWALSLAALGRTTIDDESVAATLGSVLKYREDAERVIELGLPEMVQAAVTRSGA